MHHRTIDIIIKNELIEEGELDGSVNENIGTIIGNNDDSGCHHNQTMCHNTN
jgi:hypothetical protein